MNDCLVTKLKGTVNDDQLLKVGELRYKQSGTGNHISQGDNNYYLIVSATANNKIKILTNGVKFGNTTATEKMLSQDSVNDAPFNIYTTSDAELSIENKFEIVQFINRWTKDFILKDMKFCNKLWGLVVNDAIGSIDDIPLATGRLIILNSPRFKCSVNELIEHLQNIYNFSVNSFDIQKSNLYGNLDLLHAAFPNMTPHACVTNQNCTLSLSCIKDKVMPEHLKTLDVHARVNGSLADLPDNLKFAAFNHSNNILSWPSRTSRPTNYTIFGLQGVYLGDDVENCIINLSNCRNILSESDAIWIRSIVVSGNWYNSTDAINAVNKLKNMGYIVNVNGTQL